MGIRIRAISSSAPDCGVISRQKPSESRVHKYSPIFQVRAVGKKAGQGRLIDDGPHQPGGRGHVARAAVGIPGKKACFKPANHLPNTRAGPPIR